MLFLKSWVQRPACPAAHSLLCFGNFHKSGLPPFFPLSLCTCVKCRDSGSGRFVCWYMPSILPQAARKWELRDKREARSKFALDRSLRRDLAHKFKRTRKDSPASPRVACDQTHCLPTKGSGRCSPQRAGPLRDDPLSEEGGRARYPRRLHLSRLELLSGSLYCHPSCCRLVRSYIWTVTSRPS